MSAAKSSTTSSGRAEAAGGRGGRLRAWGPWVVMLLVAAIALGIGTFGGGEPTEAERIRGLEETIRCPQCASQAVAHSDTPSARGVKVVIRERIAMGNTDEEIRDFIASRYGRDVLLEPSGTGFSAVVWALPVVVVIVAVGGLVYRFRDWRPSDLPLTDDDRARVEAARSGRGSDQS